MSKRNFLYSILLLLSGYFLGGGAASLVVSSPDNDSEGRIEHELKPRRAPSYDRKETTPSRKFGKTDLNRLISKLENERLSSGEFKKEFDHLLEYPLDHYNWNYYLAICHLMSSWGKEDPYGAFEAIKALSGLQEEMKDTLVSIALTSLIEKSPEEAAALFSDTQSRLYVYRQILPDLAASYAKKSPSEAWKWMATLPIQEQQQAMKGFFGQLYISEPGLIGEFIHKLTPPEKWPKYHDALESDLLVDIVSLWTEVSPEESKNWIKSIADDSRGLVNVFLETQARQSPSDAMETLNNWPLSETARAKAFQTIGETVFASDDLSLINSWLSTISANPPEVESDRYLFILQKNYRDAFSIIEQTRPGKVRDSLISCLLRGSETLDSNAEKKLLQQINDPQIRGEVEKSLANPQ